MERMRQPQKKTDIEEMRQLQKGGNSYRKYDTSTESMRQLQKV